nr:MAG TPA: hypothetical protein [Caudoviricetes sp.]
MFPRLNPYYLLSYEIFYLHYNKPLKKSKNFFDFFEKMGLTAWRR